MDEKKRVIESCRLEISQLDKEILSLVKRRELLSAQIGLAKKDLSVPVRDFHRERQVFEMAAKTAQELDLPINVATKLQKLIIEASLSRQEQDRIKSDFLDAPKSVLVIGGAGRLGQWLCRFFADSGHGISVVDLHKPKFSCKYSTELDESAHHHDIIVVATPIRASITMLKRLKVLQIKKPVIFDVSSVKAPVYDALCELKHSGAQVTSLHPMFGPSVELLFGKHIIRTSLGVEHADSVANEIFRATSLQVVDMSIDEHDEVISLLLSLAHLVNIVFVNALKKSRFAVEYLERFSSPTFSNLLTVAKKVLQENPHLYYEIQALNPHTESAHKKLTESLLEVIESIRNHDEQDFVSIMDAGKRYIAGEN